MNDFCMECMQPLERRDICPYCGFDGNYKVVPHQLAPGTILEERYLVGSAIGQGGFGITYIGRDLRLNMRIAIKEYYPNGYANRNVQASSNITISNKNQVEFIEEGKCRFLNEARTLAEFHEEPGVVDVRDFFEANNTAYIIMEYLEGNDLRLLLKEKIFSADEIFDLMQPIMNTLEKIHVKNMIHRDISPDNIMLLKDGTLKLMDFGAARIVDYSDQKSVSVVLKSGYAPEEQYRPKGEQGPWTDIYALCATIYRCITGVTPDDSLQRVYADELKWPSELGIAIGVNQEAALKKGLAIKQQDRFQSISELKQMLGYDEIREVQEVEISTVPGRDNRIEYETLIEEEDTDKKEPESPDQGQRDVYEKKEFISVKKDNFLKLFQKDGGKKIPEFQEIKDCFKKQNKKVWIGAGAIVIVLVVVAVCIFGSPEKQKMPEYPKYMTVLSDVSEDNSVKDIQSLEIVEEVFNEKTSTYTITCTVNTTNKEYKVRVIYELLENEWQFSQVIVLQ